MLSGYAKAAQVLQDEEYKSRAIQAADFIKKYLWSDDRKELLHCCYADDNREHIVQMWVGLKQATKIKNLNNLSIFSVYRARPIHGFLNDYAFLIRGLLDLYEITYELRWIEWAEQLQDVQDNLFWDADNKAYNLSCASQSNIITVKEGRLNSTVLRRNLNWRRNLAS